MCCVRFGLLTCVLICALAACHSLQQTTLLPASDPGGNAGLQAAQSCEQRVNDTLAKLEECIQRKSLWEHLSHFQIIADENPGPKGHGNRDTGTTGYAASVRYVAKLMQAAGYKVKIQRYVWTKSPPPGKSDIDYNVIADSPYGDSNHVVVIEGHLDSIYGAGMLDNASGSTTILEIALNMAKTRTRNQLRYIWFGGEEIGLLGSRYYTKHLTPTELHRIVFDIDADVTATPNFDIMIADPQYAAKVKHFPKNVVPESKIGNDYFADFFKAGGIVSRPAHFGNNGTDSLSFSLVGVPNSGIVTRQDCCKQPWETKLWGGFLGDYEGTVPGFHEACVDRPNRWCDNLYNNDPFVLELASKAVAYVTFKLAGRRFSW